MSISEEAVQRAKDANAYALAYVASEFRRLSELFGVSLDDIYLQIFPDGGASLWNGRYAPEQNLFTRQEWLASWLGTMLQLYAEKRETVAYERGKAEEQARIVPLLNARKQTAAVSETRAQQNNKPHIAIVYHNEIEVWDEAINIVNQTEE